MNLKFLYAKLMKKLRGACIRDSRVEKTAKIYSGTDFVKRCGMHGQSYQTENS